MSDMVEMFQDMKEECKARKSKYREGGEAALDLLRKSLPSADIREMPQAGHYRVNGRWDYWPSTGRWLRIPTRKGGRGVTSLIAAVSSFR